MLNFPDSPPTGKLAYFDLNDPLTGSPEFWGLMRQICCSVMVQPENGSDILFIYQVHVFDQEAEMILVFVGALTSVEKIHLAIWICRMLKFDYCGILLSVFQMKVNDFLVVFQQMLFQRE